MTYNNINNSFSLIDHLTVVNKNFTVNFTTSAAAVDIYTDPNTNNIYFLSIG